MRHFTNNLLQGTLYSMLLSVALGFCALDAASSPSSLQHAGGTEHLEVRCCTTFRVDLPVQELTWEDREKVLRLLFAKINNQAQQMYYANLPGHSFPVAEDSVETMQGLRTAAGPAQLI